MIDRFLTLKEVCINFNFGVFKLTLVSFRLLWRSLVTMTWAWRNIDFVQQIGRNWRIVGKFLKCYFFLYILSKADIQYQIPHAFQDILGAEATPTLCYTVFAFSSFIKRWEELATARYGWDKIIQPGLDKLDDYSSDLDNVPAYKLAMGIFFLLFINFESLTHIML